MLKKLTAVIGGAASGKSLLAENIILNTEKRAVYIATAQAFDKEMEAKIAAHQAQRGTSWITKEAPIELATALSNVTAEDAVLIDCATMWLSNLLLAEMEIDAAQNALWHAFETCPAPVVMVSNEVGAGIVPDNALARQFRALQGRFNQALAKRADVVIGVIAGCPIALKGSLPPSLEARIL